MDNNFDRKASCATTIHSKGRKMSMPLRIDCNDTNKSAFYDTGSMNDLSPTTAVSSKRDLSILNNNSPSPPRNRSLLDSIKYIPSSILHFFFKKGSQETPKESDASTFEKSVNFSKGNKGKQSQNSSSAHVGKVVRHSYSDPRLSPGSTAVGDDDEERHGYFGVVVEKKKRSPRGWVAAVMMIIVGALIAITFVLVGLGKAIGPNTNASQHTSNATTTSSSFHSVTPVMTSSQSSSTLPTASVIKITFTLKPTQT
ncbi:hypothetical protein MFLAVUS_010284 [Mucor flavus]|uniref:Uncharacterized protein n=1 Tax=Mucor flavus TaxID=439312 RepID=A0ABP9ZCC4_9FUNG